MLKFLKDHADEATSLSLILAIILAIIAFTYWLATRKVVPKVEVTNHPTPMITPPNTVMMDTEAFITLQTRLREETRAELAQTHGEERKHLQDKIDTLNARLANPDEALAQQQAIITNLEDQLTRRGNQLGGDATLAAKTALEAGDFTKARTLFETLAAETAPDVQTHADAAFALGQIAEAEVRWHDAAACYARAAQLNPTYDTQRKACEFKRRAGDYVKSLGYSTVLLDIAREQSDPAQLSDALNQQATNLQALGEFAQAERHFVEALEVTYNSTGAEHPIFATYLNNLGIVLQEQGRYSEAEVYYKQVIEIDRQTIGVDHPSFAIHINNLAAIIKAQGNYIEAEAIYNQALEINRKTIGEEHPYFAILLNNLAGVVGAQGRYSEAEGLYKQALNIDRKTIGEAHPSFAGHMNNLAGVVEAQGRYAEAGVLYKLALEIACSTLTNFHPNTLTFAHNLIDLLQTHNPSSPDLPALLAAFPNP